MSDSASESGRPPRKSSSTAAAPEQGRALSIPNGVLAWMPWIAAAGFALVAGFLLQAYIAAEGEAVQLRAQAALAMVEAKSLRQTLEAERILSARRLADRSPTGQDGNRDAESEFALMLPPNGASDAAAVAFWKPGTAEGTLLVRHLPPLPAGESYQLWIEDSQPPAQVAGTIEAAATGTMRYPFRVARPPGPGARFLVTIEPNAGSPTKTGPLVLSSQ